MAAIAAVEGIHHHVRAAIIAHVGEAGATGRLALGIPARVGAAVVAALATVFGRCARVDTVSAAALGIQAAAALTVHAHLARRARIDAVGHAPAGDARFPRLARAVAAGAMLRIAGRVDADRTARGLARAVEIRANSPQAELVRRTLTVAVTTVRLIAAKVDAAAVADAQPSTAVGGALAADAELVVAARATALPAIVVIGLRRCARLVADFAAGLACIAALTREAGLVGGTRAAARAAVVNVAEKIDAQRATELVRGTARTAATFVLRDGVLERAGPEQRQEKECSRRPAHRPPSPASRRRASATCEPSGWDSM